MNTINSSNFPPEYQDLLAHLQEKYAMDLQQLGESLIAERKTKLLQTLKKHKDSFDEMRADSKEVWKNRPEILEDELASIDRREKMVLEQTLSMFGVFSNNVKNITNRSVNNLF